MTDESLMPWGKHKGKQLADVPAADLLWYFEQGYLRGELLQYYKDNETVIKSQITYDKKKGK